jgi:hypothetical protein
MSGDDSARLNELLDWLAEAVAARLRARQGPVDAGAMEPEAPPTWPAEPEPVMVEARVSTPVKDEGQEPGVLEPALAAEWQPADAESMGAAPPSHAARLLSRLALGLLAVVVLINIPLGLRGRAIARMIPNAVSLVVRDGLLVKEAGSPDVYVYEGGEFHWVTGLEVFERRGYRWQNVHEVAPGFLDDYALGRPIYLLAKCPTSPHIYRLEDGAKRWVVDIETFEAEGYQWADLVMMDCYTLRNLPDSETIPPGRGPAPQP